MSVETSANRVLLLGASGFVGGTVLHFLLQSSSPYLRTSQITVLVRGQDQAARLSEVYGSRIKAIVFTGLDDADHIAALASQHDLVLNASVGTHVAGPAAMVRGLAARKQASLGRGLGAHPPAAWLLQVSGVTSIIDRARPERWFDDADALAIYEFARAQEAREPYFQRTADLGVIHGAEAAGVDAVLVMCPTVYGRGRGQFATKGTIIPLAMKFVTDKGYGFQLGDGSAGYGIVHVDDLARFFVLLAERIFEGGGKEIPTGKRGILFAQTGLVKVSDIMRHCVATAFRQGVLPKPDGPAKEEVRTVELDQVGAYLGGGEFGRLLATVMFASKVNTKGSMASQLGWKPEYGMDAWNDNAHWDYELQACLDGGK